MLLETRWSALLCRRSRLCLLRLGTTLGMALLTASCGGGGGSASSTSGETTAVTASSIGANGGNVSLQGLNLAVPAASLSSTTEIKLTKETVESPALARFRFDPAGQPLIQSAELKFSAAGLPANARFFCEVNGERWMIPGTVSGGVLTSQISSLGFNSAGTLLPVASTQTFDSTQAAVLRVPGSSARVELAASRVVPLPVASAQTLGRMA